MNIGIPRYTGWSFDYDWELQAGEWTIELLQGNDVVTAQSFLIEVDR